MLVRAVGRSENPGVPVVIRWAYSVPPGWSIYICKKAIVFLLKEKNEIITTIYSFDEFLWPSSIFGEKNWI